MKTADSFSDQAGTSGSRDTHEWDGVEARSEDILAVEPEVTAEDLLVDRPEIHVEADVLRRIELSEVRPLPVEAALDRVPDEEHRRCGPVVGAAARVLDRAAAELGPRGDEHPVGHPVGGEVLVE